MSFHELFTNSHAAQYTFRISILRNINDVLRTNSSPYFRKSFSASLANISDTCSLLTLPLSSGYVPTLEMTLLNRPSLTLFSNKLFAAASTWGSMLYAISVTLLPLTRLSAPARTVSKNVYFNSCCLPGCFSYMKLEQRNLIMVATLCFYIAGVPRFTWRMTIPYARLPSSG